MTHPYARSRLNLIANYTERIAMDLDAGSQVQVLLSGTRTTVLTRLNRQDLVDYLKRLTEALESKIDTQDQSDVLSADMTTLPSGDTVWEVVMQLDVF